MQSNLPTRSEMSSKIEVRLPADEKRRLFEDAAAKGVTVSHLIRQAVASSTTAAS